MSRRFLFIKPGQRFHYLTAIREITEYDIIGTRLKPVRKIICKCDCGKEIKVRITGLYRLNRPTMSCGCIKKISKKGNKNGIIHGLSYNKLYRVWIDIKTRTQNPNSPSYENYGGRGIEICNEWLNVESFIKWAEENGYRPGLQIDRINNNGNYSPANCRFTDKSGQMNNTRKNRYMVYNNEKLTVTEFARKFGLKIHNIRYRLDRGTTDPETILKIYKHL